MDHRDHIRLLREGVKSTGSVWAEFGSGRGAFTLALADLIGPDGTIYSIDKDQPALEEQARRIKQRFPPHHPTIHYLHKDYTSPLNLPGLNGVLMANTLHFQNKKPGILRMVEGYLLPGGRLIIVEYNSDHGNTWVPYPISFRTWQLLAEEAGFTGTHLLEKVPSSFMGEIYSAISYKVDDTG